MQTYIAICSIYERISQYALRMTALPQDGMLNYAFMFKKMIRLKYKNLIDNCTYNVQSHYVKVKLYFLFKIMLYIFHLAGLLDQKCEKIITTIILKSRKAVLPIFVSICFVVNCSC